MKCMISRDDIKKGKKESPHSCPIARSLRRNGCSNICVGGVITFRKGGQNFCYRTTEKLRMFIYRFDSGKPVQPMPFRLTLPRE